MDLPETNQQALTTMTGELMQAIRLHYDIFNKKELLRIFNQLGCMDFDPSGSRWDWVYAGEASSLKFKRSYDDLPEGARRVVLGSFFITSETRMHLDVRSVERALAAVEFFDRRIPHAVAEMSYICILNRLFSDPEEFPENFDVFFDTEEVRNFDLAVTPTAMTEDILGDTLEDASKGAKWQMPEVDCFSVIYFKEGLGIGLIDLKLSGRRAITFKHFMGDTDYSIEDYVRELWSRHKARSSTRESQ